MFLTILTCLTIGIIGRVAYRYFKGSFDWEDETAEAIVSIIFSATIAWVVDFASEHKIVMWVLLVAVGFFVIKRFIEWANKWHWNQITKE
jgi:chromate transport protein ChrA